MASKAERAVEAVATCAATLLSICGEGDEDGTLAQVAVPALVGLLSCGEQAVAAKAADRGLADLTFDHISAAAVSNRDAIREAGSIKPLVALAAGAGSEVTKEAVRALHNLVFMNAANQDAVREAGAIAPLVAVLAVGAGSDEAVWAVGALANLQTARRSGLSQLAGGNLILGCV
jgi:hypothetical protein